MVRECFLANTGIQFYRDSLKVIGLDPDSVYPIVIRRPKPLNPLYSTVTELRASAHKAEATEATLANRGEASPIAASTFESEEGEELADITSSIYDQLKIKWGWWILEILFLRHHRLDRKDMSRKPYWSYVFFFPKVLLYSRSRHSPGRG